MIVKESAFGGTYLFLFFLNSVNIIQTINSLIIILETCHLKPLNKDFFFGTFPINRMSFKKLKQNSKV